MKVIVAGFSKTGTKTMLAALTELRYNVHDYMEHYEYAGKEWNQIFKEGGSTELFRRMYENVDAVTDLPACMFWDEILKTFPDAKIVLTMRESEDKWFDSLVRQQKKNMSSMIQLLFNLSPTGFQMNQYGIRMIRTLVGQDFKFNTNKMNETLFRMTYRRHNAHVLQNAPKDQLLVFNFKDGWGPLCDFLGVPTPSTPFPHENKNGSIVDKMMETNKVVLRMKREFQIVAATATVLGVLGLFKAIKVTRQVDWTGIGLRLTNYIWK